MSGRSEVLHRAIRLIEAGHSPESALEALRAAGEIDAADQGALIEDLRFAFDLRRAARPRAPGALRERLALALLEAPEPGDLPADDLPDAAPATDAVGEGARDATSRTRFRIPGRLLRRPALRLGFAAIAMILALSSSIVILAAAPTLPEPWQAIQRISRGLVDRLDGNDRAPETSGRNSDTEVEHADGDRLAAAPTAIRRVDSRSGLQDSRTSNEGRTGRDDPGEVLPEDLETDDAPDRLTIASTGDRTAGTTTPPRAGLLASPAPGSTRGPVANPTVDARASTATSSPPTAPGPPSQDPDPDPDPDDPTEAPSSTATPQPVLTTVAPTASATTSPSPQPTRGTSATPSPSLTPVPPVRTCGGLAGQLLDPLGQGFGGEAILQLLQQPARSTMGGDSLVAERSVQGGRYSVDLTTDECLRLPASGDVYPVLIALPSASTAGGEVIGWRGNWQGGPEAAALDNNSRAGTDLTLFVDAIPANAQPCRRGSGSAEGAVIQSGRPVGGARIRFESTTGAGSGELRFFSSAPDGSFQAGGLCAGDHAVSAQLPLAPGPAFGQLRQPVTIDPNIPVTGLQILLDGGLWNLGLVQR